MSFLKTIFKNKVFRVTLILIILVLPFTSNYRAVIVHGESMYPTYKNREIVIEEKISSLGKNWHPNRGDVIVVYTGSGERVIKRVVGLSGETVEIVNGLIYIDAKEYIGQFTNIKIGILLVDTYGEALEDWETGGEIYEYENKKYDKLEEGELWVIGDNRRVSWYGIIRVGDIEGKVLY